MLQCDSIDVNKTTGYLECIIYPKVFNFSQKYVRAVLKCFLKNIHIYNIKILYYDRIDVSEGIDVDKTSASKECTIFHYCYF